MLKETIHKTLRILEELRFQKIVHRIRYGLLTMKYPNMLKHGGIELTNTCNLLCKDCPTPTTKALRGFANERSVKLAMKYARPGQLFSFHRQGEPLLHPDLLRYVKLASKKGLRPLASTNGILLTEDLFHKLLKAGIRNLQITLHSKKSVAAYKMVADYFIQNNIQESKIYFCGNLLSGNQSADKWLDELNVSTEARRYVRRIGTHTWAGSIKGKHIAFSKEIRTRRMNNCCFLNNNTCSIRWDGTVLACCFDSENVDVIGNVEDFLKLKHRPDKYKLCTYCGPSWANKEMY